MLVNDGAQEQEQTTVRWVSQSPWGRGRDGGRVSQRQKVAQAECHSINSPQYCGGLCLRDVPEGCA